MARARKRGLLGNHASSRLRPPVTAVDRHQIPRSPPSCTRAPTRWQAPVGDDRPMGVEGRGGETHGGEASVTEDVGNLLPTG